MSHRGWERGRCCLWGYAGFTSPLCKATYMNTFPSQNHTDTLNAHTPRVDVHQKHNGILLLKNVTRPLKGNTEPKRRKTERLWAVVTGRRSACARLTAPTSTDCDVCPLAPSHTQRQRAQQPEVWLDSETFGSKSRKTIINGIVQLWDNCCQSSGCVVVGVSAWHVKVPLSVTHAGTMGY